MSKSIPIEQAVQMALEQHRAGNFARAEALYVEILRQDPGNIDAMHLLGVLAQQGGQPQVAVDLIGRAISRKPDVAVFHYNLAEALNAVGRPDDAIAAYRRSLELDSEQAAAYANLSSTLVRLHRWSEAQAVCEQGLAEFANDPALLNNLGTALRGQGDVPRARGFFEQAIAERPEFAEAITNLAMVMCTQGEVDAGVARFEQALRLRPASADAHNNLGTAYVALKRFPEAIERFRTAIDLKPDHAEATNNLGSTLRTMGKPDQALTLFKRAVELQPDFVEANANLAATYGDFGKNKEAIAPLQHAIALRPNVGRMHFLLGILLRNLHRNDEGIASIRRALELEPEAGDALIALGYALLEQGELDQAIDALKRSIAVTHDPGTHSNTLMTLNYHPGLTPADLMELHRGWSAKHEAPVAGQRRPHDNDRTPGRKLRVGYVSPDFRGHAVAFFLEPILANHDRAQFEIYGYAQVANFDLATYRLRSEIDQWRETSGKSAAEVEQMIREDQIDILIDLAGHTGSNLLTVFALKPAPVQINLIGFPSTTGLSAMDYRITDARCDPPGASDAHSSETLIRMPRLFWAYQPPDQAMPVGPLPADENGGRVTFTSVNNFTKVTPQVQAMWARLLQAVPESRLIIQTSAMSSPDIVDRVRRRFADEGVDVAGRLEFRPWSDMQGYLALLERSDITLDPFPFNGGTTTCHSLWMGAAVLTLAGDRHASRMGLSMMTSVGLPEFVAHTPEAYVEIGQRMAADLPRMREIRSGMRDRLRASPLLDGPGYTRELEAVYREVWAKWCATGV